MSRNKNSQFKFVPFALTFALVGLILLATLVIYGENTFPAIQIGAYRGRISGVTGQEDKFATLYVERTGDGDRLLVVVFREGWHPQVVLLNPAGQNDKTSSSDPDQIKFKPITIKKGDQTFQLDGTAGNNEYSGNVLDETGRIGTWSLAPVDPEELRQPALSLGAHFSLTEWLRLKGAYHRRNRELEDLEKNISENLTKHSRLTDFVEEKDALRRRSMERRTKLSDQVAELDEEVRTAREEVQRLVRELGQLTRITRRGRSIDLARRVAKRENKWYFVNWQKGQDLSALEESLAEKMDVDLRKLRERVKKASEIQELKNAVARERKRVIELQKIYQDKIDEDRRKKLQPKEKKYKRPWWERWDTVFG